ncbi:MAG: VWA domain-containing protein [Nostoc sp.]
MPLQPVVLYQSYGRIFKQKWYNLCGTSAQTTPKGGIDWILVVDTSASMRGVRGTKNIFEPVKNSVTEFVNTARLGDTVTIYSFDQDVTVNANDVSITSNADRGKLKEIISSLQAQGIRTYTGKLYKRLCNILPC